MRNREDITLCESRAFRCKGYIDHEESPSVQASNIGLVGTLLIESLSVRLLASEVEAEHIDDHFDRGVLGTSMDGVFAKIPDEAADDIIKVVHGEAALDVGGSICRNMRA